MSKLSRMVRRVRHSVLEALGATYELDGTRFTLPSWADDIKRNVKRGNYEAAERRLVIEHLDGQLPVVELGGSFGIVSGVIGRNIGAATPQLIVEANPLLVDYCRANAMAPRAPNAPVTVVNAAIAYGSGEVVEFLQSDAFLGSRLAVPGETGAIRVPAITLSQLLAAHLPDQDYELVCDIEGAEFDLLMHDAAALKRCALAIVELHPDAFASKGSSEDAFLAMLSDAGFTLVAREENVVVASRRAKD
jgi:FkbM family methyltransferase